MTPTHTNVRHLTRKGEWVVCKLYVENLFSALALSNYLTDRKLDCCGTVLPNHKGMPRDFGHKTLKMKWEARIRRDKAVMIWKDKRERLTNMHQPQQKETSRMNRPSSSPLCKAISCTWVIEWKIPIQWIDIHSYGQISCSFIHWTYPFWIAHSCFHLVVLRVLIKV